MSPYALDKYRGLTFEQVRFPVLDALSCYSPDPDALSPAAVKLTAEGGPSRWRSESGGVRIVVPYQGQPYDPAEVELIKDGWNHDTCDCCQVRIPAMTLCWYSTGPKYWILCDQCKAALDGDPAAEEAISFPVLEGPVEKIDGQLTLRIPLAAGTDELVASAKGIGTVEGEFLVVRIPEWLARNLDVREGSRVGVANRNGKFFIENRD